MIVIFQTLRKGASDQEKIEFLQEAQLMSNFKHEHILQLIGVCLDNDPHYIIMELMQGGDLLTYLRSSRNPSVRLMLPNFLEFSIFFLNFENLTYFLNLGRSHIHGIIYLNL